MRASPVTPNLPSLNRLKAVNAFLVREADGFTLIDTMTGCSARLQRSHPPTRDHS